MADKNTKKNNKPKTKSKNKATKWFKDKFGNFKDWFKQNKLDKISNSKLEQGRMFIYQYKAETPIKILKAYDANPLVMCLGQSKKHKHLVINLSFHWIPQNLRKDALNYMLTLSKTRNAKKVFLKNKPIKIDYDMLMSTTKGQKFFKYAIRTYYKDSSHMKNVHPIDNKDIFENIKYDERMIVGSKVSTNQMIKKYMDNYNS